MRKPRAAVARLPALAAWGEHIRGHLAALLQYDVAYLESCGGILDGKPGAPPPAHLVQEARRVVAANFGVTCEVGPTSLWTDLPDLVAEHTDDPEQYVGSWLKHGAPMGITETIEASNVFPPAKEVPDEATGPGQDGGAFWFEGEEWTNYVSAEEDPETVLKLLEDFQGKGYCKKFETEKQLREAVGNDYVLSRLALISKERSDGTWKHRLILDMRRSGVNS
jgi:hypothetical protein